MPRLTNVGLVASVGCAAVILIGACSSRRGLNDGGAGSGDAAAGSSGGAGTGGGGSVGAGSGGGAGTGSGGSAGTGSGGRANTGGSGGATDAGAMSCAPGPCGGVGCRLDCQGRTGQDASAALPIINCSCANFSNVCVVSLGPADDGGAPACPGTVDRGSPCSPACSVCATPNDAGAVYHLRCFCSADLVWVCN